MTKYSVCAIICAAGKGNRAGFEQNKLLVPYQGSTVLEKTVSAFNFPAIDEIIIMASKEDFDVIKTLVKSVPSASVVLGGATRSESVYNALKQSKADIALIHDGARPLILPEDISRCARDAFRCGGAVLAVPVTDTIKYGKKNGFVEYTPAREKLFAAQTPQIFDIRIYKAAMERAFRELSDWTDDSRIFENDARKVFLTPGKRYNIKITSPEDILIAEALLKGRDSE